MATATAERMTRRRLFARRKPRGAPSVPPGLQLYAIGDIHGRSDLLKELHRQILRDIRSSDSALLHRIIYLGDYVDRGLDSKGVIDALLSPMPSNIERVFLMGNHDEIVLRFLDDPTVGPSWLPVGGDATLMSYGVRLPAEREPSARFEAIRAELQRRLPRAHREFLCSLALSHEVGDYLFVHAGVRPEVPLDRQSPEDLLWIRDDFLSWDKALDKTIVHGHSPAPEPELRAHRIGIDTGAYATNVLTCLVLEGSKRRFLST